MPTSITLEDILFITILSLSLIPISGTAYYFDKGMEKIAKRNKLKKEYQEKYNHFEIVEQPTFWNVGKLEQKYNKTNDLS